MFNTQAGLLERFFTQILPPVLLLLVCQLPCSGLLNTQRQGDTFEVMRLTTYCTLVLTAARCVHSVHMCDKNIRCQTLRACTMANWTTIICKLQYVQTVARQHLKEKPGSIVSLCIPRTWTTDPQDGKQAVDLLWTCETVYWSEIAGPPQGPPPLPPATWAGL
jgi:hypothetical protein